MTRIRSGMIRTAAGLCLAAGATFPLACNHSGDAQDFKPTTTTFLTGTSSTPPDLEGTWLVQSSPVSSACGALNVLFVSPTVMTVGPMSLNGFDFTLADSCGRPVPGGKGTVDLSGNVTLSSDARRRLTASCELKLVQKRLGAVESPPNLFSGTDVLTISASDQPGQDACSATLPCRVRGTFTATRCPRTGCAVTCTTS
jgi:hypothetical protein